MDSYYWAAPYLIRRDLVTSARLNRPFVRGACAVALFAMSLWAMANFNLDTSMMGNFPYGCVGAKTSATCGAATWTVRCVAVVNGRACVRAGHTCCMSGGCG